MPTDDADDDVGGFGQPLPPDDRLWRHPSEMFGDAGRAEGPLLVQDPPAPASDRSWTVTAGAAMVGALLATGVFTILGAPWTQPAPRDVVERVALSPVVSAPTVRGDRRVAEVTEQVAPSVARVEGGADGSLTGSAVAFRDDGHLLTSASLVEGASSVTLVIGGERLDARVVGADGYSGVAVLRLTPGLPPAVLGDPSDLAVGVPAVALGSAFGNGNGGSTVATGVVSGLDRRLDRPGEAPLYGMIQIDVPIADGVVGGPVLDSRGAVIGIAEAAPGDSSVLGFAIPIDVARRVADDIIDTGAARHCWLGIEGTDLDPEDAKELRVLGGAAVHQVLEGSPAAQVGVEPGDVITGFAGQPVSSMAELVALMRGYQPGDAVALELRRADDVVTMRVELGLRP